MEVVLIELVVVIGSVVANIVASFAVLVLKRIFSNNVYVLSWPW